MNILRHSYLAKLQENGLLIGVRDQLEILDGGLRDAPLEVQAVCAQLLIPLGGLISHDYSILLAMAPLVPACHARISAASGEYDIQVTRFL